jgi:hypothetical protein
MILFKILKLMTQLLRVLKKIYIQIYCLLHLMKTWADKNMIYIFKICIIIWIDAIGNS